ncbi:MAG TPA: enoyl-CoA hydratase/isomerase family protein [Gammaproteobacteria bacterium]|jgi:enoyl-CoA hydratase/carnithine racemase|nr:enoyl-CoA hydratase/isomerase family protein [Gammaproteobacteria bacterium]HIA43903.1 enoyl-CoA hydratase/isomerase family protein [Gammaproteobacteria bacterium]HIB74586.1 enoyl-CoA hydratase/isomerase family protein [Gammaproteobacteria bacterium]HIN74181.1 enoyl-CoA hydratase/isomerase family protein [Gammaproteobacteria bacterium]HIO43254.1 enoyl-CoA hydratase/isomerase family protein [Gammaproteobacteria bacterium]
MVDYKHLEIEDQGQIIICYLSNPPTHTLTAQGLLEIHDFLDSLVTNKELRILAFTGAGEDVFIRHYEVGELADSAEKNISQQEETKKLETNPIKELHGFHKMLLKIRDLNAIVVAGINGNTAGGGCEFSLGCDLRVMSSGDYFIGLPETSVGILPGGGGTQRLARLIGSSRALDLILHGQLISNVKALEFGIINEILPKESFLKSLKEYCQILANRAPIALREVKRAIHRGMDLPLEEALLIEQEAFNKTMNSKDAAKAMRTMLNSKEEIDVISKLEWSGE